MASDEVTASGIRYTAAGVDGVIRGEIADRRLWLTEWYGERCPDFYETCIICRVWRNQDDFEKLVDSVEGVG